MLAASVYDLGLTAAEFSSFTPRHIDRMLKRCRERYQRTEEAANRRIEDLMVFYLNCNRNTDKHPDPYTREELFTPAQSNGLAAHAERQMAQLEEFSRKALEHGVKPPLRKWVPNG